MNDVSRQVMQDIAEAQRKNREHITLGAEMRGAQHTPGAGGRWFVTHHAIEKWIERFTPRSFREAERTEAQRARVLGWIIDEAERARFVKALDTGVQLWRGPKPRRVRFIVTVCSEGTLPALLTVMPACDGWM